MNDQYIKELAQAFVDIKSTTMGEAFLRNILTPGELDEISKRLQIVKLLLKGVSQRDVAKKLDVSMGTVSRGSRELKYGENGFRKILQGD
ncbi:MAG: YerC/YecD family TrpR-related protein [Patescibacteria group bacterium]